MGIIAIRCDSNMEHKGTPCRQHADTLNVTKGSFTQTTTVFYKVNANLAANTDDVIKQISEIQEFSQL